MSRKKIVFLFVIINPVLTKLIFNQGGWILASFLSFLHKHVKKRDRLVNRITKKKRLRW